MYDITAPGEVLIDFTLMQTGADGYPVLAAHPGGAPEALSKEQMEQIVRFATRVAGLSTTRSGGISSIPSDEELS